MASLKTLKLYNFMADVRYRFGVVPYRLVRNGIDVECVCGSKRQRYLWFCSLAYNSAFMAILPVGIGLYYEFTQPLTMAERCQYYFVGSCLALAFSFHILTLIFTERTRGLINQFFRFNTRLHKELGLNPDDKDGIERYLQALQILTFSTSPAMIPLCVILVMFRQHLLDVFDANIWIAGIGGFPFAYIGLADWAIVDLYAVKALGYVNSVMRSMRTLLRKLESGEMSASDVLRVYRGHTVLHNLAMAECKHVTALAIGLGSCILTTSLYLIIAFHGQAQGMAVFTFFVSCLVFALVKACLETATGINEASRTLLDSFPRVHPTSLSQSSMLRKQLRASRPLLVIAGNFIDITSNTFPYLMSDVVLARLVDLLLIA